MKRKEARETIERVNAKALAVEGSMSLLNKGTGEAYGIDMRQALAIARGALAWCANLLERGARAEETDTENLHQLLTCVGESLVCDLSDDEGEGVDTCQTMSIGSHRSL